MGERMFPEGVERKVPWDLGGPRMLPPSEITYPLVLYGLLTPCPKIRGHRVLRPPWTGGPDGTS